MRICIVGAGAVGGVLGFRLATAGHAVSLVTRGPHREAIDRDGLGHLGRDGAVRRATSVRAVAQVAEAGPQDLVILAGKSHQIPPVAPDLPALFAADTPVVALQNGLPWWYFHCHGGALEGTRLETVDPGGIVSRHVDGHRVIGSVAWGAYRIVEPGVVEGGDSERDRFPLGEPDGTVSARVEALSRMFAEAGIRAPVVPDIRAEKWFKLWGNAALNPIGALAHATIGQIYAHGPARELARNLMVEVARVAGSVGVAFPVALDARLANSAALGAVRTSTHQDVEAGRRLEVDALVGAVSEIGRLTDTPTPLLDALYACCLLLDQVIADGRVRIATEPLE
ncbi:2-dehydropantoate 2-reductase [Stella humosa]|uniref:2-dehydropantoate 2-reductase n=1 Tax=Stella humosa TaxID=94 RepID=A0A3N1M8F3_9PROT|nr:2-dehydropantoate 2-reductase [Stella humosa]ROP99960.1 2-dehydropantoate 2-reductase [Stella humosa]BBK30809.1 2-dehydropantoate 2-reductase [Stella humosa]